MKITDWDTLNNHKYIYIDVSKDQSRRKQFEEMDQITKLSAEENNYLLGKIYKGI